VNLPPLFTPKPVDGWNPQAWRIDDYLDPDFEIENLDRYLLSDEQQQVIEVWNDFLRIVDRSQPLPGFPIWADAFQYPAVIPEDTPAWKANFLRKNAEFYRANQRALDKWLARHSHLRDLAPSRRKLEWQAQNTQRNLWNCVLHFRPSGIRAKKPTYLPAMVAITQTSIIGPRRRRITPREGLRLQGMPWWFSFHNQPEAQSYKQLGNGVNAGVVQHVLRQHAERDKDFGLPDHLYKAFTSTPMVLPQPAWHTLDVTAAVDLNELSEAAPLSL
jgi:DNA (cytosine-5)-methyltransferase 1